MKERIKGSKRKIINSSLNSPGTVAFDQNGDRQKAKYDIINRQPSNIDPNKNPSRDWNTNTRMKRENVNVDGRTGKPPIGVSVILLYYPSSHPFFCSFARPSMPTPVRPSVHLFVCPSIYLFTRWSVHHHSPPIRWRPVPIKRHDDQHAAASRSPR